MNQSARTAKTEMKKYYYYQTHARTHWQGGKYVGAPRPLWPPKSLRKFGFRIGLWARFVSFAGKSLQICLHSWIFNYCRK